MASENSESVIVKLDAHLMDALDKICEEWGIRSRADVIERLIEEVLAPDSSEYQPADPNSTQGLEVLRVKASDLAVQIAKSYG
jgi:metal-responsive CopG/Arc/MetJ family transcriptional regulator